MSPGLHVPESYEPLDRDLIEALLKEWERRTQIENRDRTLAIVSGVDLEESLGKLILALMIDDEEAENTLNHTLNTFYSRIQIAYCLGLISSDEYIDLHIIRRIRNYFAHSTKGSSFENPQAMALCMNLRIPQQHPDLFDSLSPSERFGATVFVLSQNIWHRISTARRRRSSVPDEIDSAQWEEFFG